MRCIGIVVRWTIVSELPTYFLFAPDGSLAATYVGEMESLSEEVVVAVDRYLPKTD